jgi:multidrug transporter EmrE-like cation transporter
VAIVLLAISATFFSESITLPRMCGIVLCLAGLWLVAR